MSVFSGSLPLPLLLWKLFVRNMPFLLAKLLFIDNQYCTKAQYMLLFEQHTFFSSLNITGHSEQVRGLKPV